LVFYEFFNLKTVICKCIFASTKYSIILNFVAFFLKKGISSQKKNVIL